MLAVGCTGSNSDQQENISANTQSSSQNIYHDAEWANNVNLYTEIIVPDGNNYSSAIGKSDYYTTFAALDNYTKNIESAIKTSDSIQVSPELQSCKDEYRLAMLDDYNSAILTKQGISSLASGDFESSDNALELVTSKYASANKHYENTTSLLNTYNSNHPGSELGISLLYHDISSEEKPTSQTSTPATKTLADKEPESNEPHPSETTNENSNSVDSSTDSIFDYCTWEASLTHTIGKYYTSPAGKSYVIVTIKINNTGDQTYSTNPGYWHLEIGDMYYQPDSATYDGSLNHLTTDVGPGGKITTKIAYIVDGEPSISDMNMYYDGPGSDGTIDS